MAQQMMGRMPTVFDLPAMVSLARRTPKVVERDLEGETHLRIEIMKAIAQLEQTKAEIQKGVISGMTDMATKFAATQADMLSALADEAKAQGMTAAAKAAVFKYNNDVLANAQGLVASGQPEKAFSEKLADPATGIAADQTAMANALSNPNAETAQLYAELGEATGASAVGPGFEPLVDALDQQFVTPMVNKVSGLVRSDGTQSMLVPNSYGAMRQIGTGVAAALGQAVEAGKISPEAAKQVYAELTLRAGATLQQRVIADTGNPDIYTNFAQSQSQAKDEIAARTEAEIKRLGVGINPATKKTLLNNNQKIIGLITTDDPFAQTQVAKDRLAAKGYTEPKPLPAGADPDVQKAWDLQKKTYDDALRQEVATTIPMEGFAQRLANLPVAPGIDESIKFLKSQLGEIGKVPKDRFTAATAALRAKMGDAQFDAWRKLTGSTTDEDAAMAAAKDPTKLAVFRRVAGTEQNILTNPEQYRKVIATETANEAGAARQAAEESAAAYAAEGEAVVPPELPEARETARGRIVSRTPEEQAAREASLPEFPSAKPADITPVQAAPTKFDTRGWEQGINDAMQEQPKLPAIAPDGTVSAAMPTPPPFQTALASTTGARAQLFGPQGFMAQRARGITG